MGFKKDVGLIGNDYSWVSSMFYFGYLAFEYPTNRLLQRLPIGKFSACAIIAWGAVLCCMAGVSNYGGALAVRFFLGVTESAVTPGFALITSQWYTKAEQGTRVGIWFCFNGWAQILGGLVAYGIARGVEKHGSSVEAWKINFVSTHSEVRDLQLHILTPAKRSGLDFLQSVSVSFSTLLCQITSSMLDGCLKKTRSSVSSASGKINKVSVTSTLRCTN